MLRRSIGRAGWRAALCATLLCAAGATPALAGDWDRSGYYVGVFGAAGFDVKGIDVDPSGGLNIKLGYRRGARTAIEMEGEWMQRFASTNSSDGVETWIAGLNGKVYMATGRVQPYGVAGFGIFYMNDTRPTGGGKSLGVAGKVGAGLEFYLNPDLLVGPEVRFNWTTGADIPFRSVSAGFGISFY